MLADPTFSTLVLLRYFIYFQFLSVLNAISCLCQPLDVFLLSKREIIPDKRHLQPVRNLLLCLPFEHNFRGVHLFTHQPRGKLDSRKMLCLFPLYLLDLFRTENYKHLKKIKKNSYVAYERVLG